MTLVQLVEQGVTAHAVRRDGGGPLVPPVDHVIHGAGRVVRAGQSLPKLRVVHVLRVLARLGQLRQVVGVRFAVQGGLTDAGFPRHVLVHLVPDALRDALRGVVLDPQPLAVRPARGRTPQPLRHLIGGRTLDRLNGEGVLHDLMVDRLVPRLHEDLFRARVADGCGGRGVGGLLQI